MAMKLFDQSIGHGMVTRASMSDVAARAGVSVTTVSHVLNDVPGKRIRLDTRDRVRQAAIDLDYEVNSLARSLRLQHSPVIGFISDEVLITPFAVDLVLGALEAASELGWMVMLTNTGVDRQFETAEIRAFQQRQVTAFLYVRMYHQEVVIPEILSGYPTVLVDGSCADPLVSSVVPDEFGGGWTAARLFAAHGHTRIAMITTANDIPAAHGRQAGFRAGLSDAGLDLPSDFVVPFLLRPGESDAASGRRAARALLELPTRPEAIFCFTDRIAMGVYQAAQDLGLQVPTDLSVIGFDNQPGVADGLFPGLTSLALPHREMGAWGVKTLIDQVTNPDETAPSQVLLPCPLVARESVARAPAPVSAGRARPRKGRR
jgi:LacI family transcriptional regulator